MPGISRSFSDDPHFGFSQSKPSLRLARIYKLNRDKEGKLTGYCGVLFLDDLSKNENALLTFDDIGNAGFAGGLPEYDESEIAEASGGQGTLCIVGMLGGKDAVVLRYVHPRVDLLRQNNCWNLEAHEKQIRSKSGSEITWDNKGNLIILVKKSKDKKAEPVIKMLLGEVFNTASKEQEAILDSKTNKRILCQIKTKTGVEINIDEDGNFHLLGLQRYIEDCVEKEFNNDKFKMLVLDKLEAAITKANIDCDAFTFNEGTFGALSAFNHPCCFFTGAPLKGSLKVKLSD